MTLQDSNSFLISPLTASILLAAFSVMWIALGIYWGKKNKSYEDFSVAGRNIGLAFGSATAVATWVTSNTTMMAPQFALQMGVVGMLAYCSASIGLFLFAPLAARIRKLMPNAFTSGDFMRLRYGKTVWRIYLVITILYSLTWLVSMAMAGGIVLETLSGISYEIGLSVILLVCVIYTLRGGLYAVIGTDFIQTIIILFGVIFVGFSLLKAVPVEEIHQQLMTHKPKLLNLLLPASIITIFNNLFFGIGEVFHNNVWWSRVFAFKESILRKAFSLGALIWLPIPIAAGFIALAAGKLGLNIPSPDMAGPMIAAHILGKSGAVIIFIVIFSSIASSVDSLLAASSDLITEDIYRKMLNPKATDKELQKFSQYCIVSLAVFALLVSLPRIDDLATVLFFAGPLVGSLIWPIVAGLYWQRANSKTAAIAILAGSACGLLVYFQYAWFAATLTATLVSMFITVIGLFSSKSRFNWKELC